MATRRRTAVAKKPAAKKKLTPEAALKMLLVAAEKEGYVNNACSRGQEVLKRAYEAAGMKLPSGSFCFNTTTGIPGMTNAEVRAAKFSIGLMLDGKVVHTVDADKVSKTYYA
jgi:hypothetical protein